MIKVGLLGQRSRSTPRRSILDQPDLLPRRRGHLPGASSTSIMSAQSCRRRTWPASKTGQDFTVNSHGYIEENDFDDVSARVGGAGSSSSRRPKNCSRKSGRSGAWPSSLRETCWKCRRSGSGSRGNAIRRGSIRFGPAPTSSFLERPAP